MDTAATLAMKPKTIVKDLRIGDKGSAVESMQKELVESGHPVATDGVFGPQTDLAVRSFQRSHGLLPDGIVGPKTRRAFTGPGVPIEKMLDGLVKRLGVFIHQSATSALHLPWLELPSSHPAGMHMSADGLAFLKSEESKKDVSNHLYWPGGGYSGVTLGAGYDLGQRSAQDIVEDLQAIGLDETTARKAARGQGLRGEKAHAFANANKNLINLTAEQEDQLLRNTVVDTENSVKFWMHVPLQPHEFDALVSFAYNINTSTNNKHALAFGAIANSINTGKVASAMSEMKKWNKSGADVMEILVNRREREISLYLHGTYGHKQVGKK